MFLSNESEHFKKSAEVLTGADLERQHSSVVISVPRVISGLRRAFRAALELKTALTVESLNWLRASTHTALPPDLSADVSSHSKDFLQQDYRGEI